MQLFPPIEKAIGIVGGVTKLARMLRVSPPTVHEWKTGGRPVPVKRCMPIVLATNGAVSLRDLRPNDWQQIWPQSHTNTAQTATESVANQGA